MAKVSIKKIASRISACYFFIGMVLINCNHRFEGIRFYLKLHQAEPEG